MESVLARNHYIETAEIFLNYFERAPIFAFAHHPGKVGGGIEHRPIHSSYLSRMIQSEQKLQQKTYLLPHVARGLHMDCQTQLMISISCGFAHGIDCPRSAKHLCYLYDWNDRFQGLLNRIMGKATEKLMVDSLQSVDVLWVSRRVLIERVRPYFFGPIQLLDPDRRKWADSLKQLVANV